GLDRRAADVEIWQQCQDDGWLLITDNRNENDENSLEATLRTRGTGDSLPVLTISNSQRLRQNREYAERVVESLFGILIDVENLRGTGRLYLA
ncbi:MAG TPA: hypothetical protein VJ783_27320, partial [Pirellulales bacterium]|nr:hypothetical protein [Pirellulales bacterium]